MKKLGKENKIFIFLTAVLSVLFIILAIILFDRLNISEKKDIYASFIVSDRYGFDLNDSALTFGMVAPGQSSFRRIFIENKHDNKVSVTVMAFGNIKDYIIVSENEFNLKPHEKKSVVFTAYAPKNISFGKYDGKISFLFKNAG